MYLPVLRGQRYYQEAPQARVKLIQSSPLSQLAVRAENCCLFVNGMEAVAEMFCKFLGGGACIAVNLTVGSEGGAVYGIAGVVLVVGG